MKQILQSLKTGATEIADVPGPAVQRGQILIRSTHTLVSAGAERMLVDASRRSVDRIEGRPEVLRMTWPTDLLGAAYERRVNAWDGLALFRVLLVGELRKG